ncbi:MAG: bifunctional precorrin-2 dehydrogenase/sirohydrochlorin ferrochelatase [Poseidonibacter sp.]|uniref:precorrin-2 dehydrogenase/sirohydrochlorin ferrochelatase family protein n=1 Tax=Poseidonibacter sp. TaxID=2321188 RepID=UPI00359D4BCC
MSYFPAFIRFDNKKILIVGAGKIAFEKCKHLLDFTSDITIISSFYCDEIKELISSHSLDFIQKDYEKGDIKGFDIVIAALDNLSIQESIYQESREFNCLCNCVDFTNYCDFIFPSYIKKGDLTIAISTSGTSPSMAKHLKIYLQKLIPDSIEDFLKQMKEYRDTMPKGKKRMEFLNNKTKEYISKWK